MTPKKTLSRPKTNLWFNWCCSFVQALVIRSRILNAKYLVVASTFIRIKLYMCRKRKSNLIRVCEPKLKKWIMDTHFTYLSVKTKERNSILSLQTIQRYSYKRTEWIVNHPLCLWASMTDSLTPLLVRTRAASWKEKSTTFWIHYITNIIRPSY